MPSLPCYETLRSLVQERHEQVNIELIDPKPHDNRKHERINKRHQKILGETLYRVFALSTFRASESEMVGGPVYNGIVNVTEDYRRIVWCEFESSVGGHWDGGCVASIDPSRMNWSKATKDIHAKLVVVDHWVTRLIESANQEFFPEDERATA